MKPSRFPVVNSLSEKTMFFWGWASGISRNQTNYWLFCFGAWGGGPVYRQPTEEDDLLMMGPMPDYLKVNYRLHFPDLSTEEFDRIWDHIKSFHGLIDTRFIANEII